MDARLDPAKDAGRAEEDARVIRNAGPPASDDAIRRLVISRRPPGTREWFVVHHADCGMLLTWTVVDHPTTPRAWPRTSAGSEAARWCRGRSRSTGTSTA